MNTEVKMHNRIFNVKSILISTTIVAFVSILFFRTSVLRAAESVVAQLVNTVDASLWSPPSPDPAGITYNPITNTLLVTDSEVDEMTIYQGANFYETTLAGQIVSTANTLAFSAEPTDITINTTNGHIFISDDNKLRVTEVNVGADGTFGTVDDIRTYFSTTAYGNSDPEGLAYGAGKLYLIDGVLADVFIVDPGVNGIFDGVAPTGDDQVSSFDVGTYGLIDPEGIAYNQDNNTLFILESTTSLPVVKEVTTQGSLVRSIDISAAGSRKAAGIVYAPSSNNPNEKSLYIVARGVDNDGHPDENDGKMYELTLTQSQPTSTPTGTLTPSPTATMTPTATPTPTMAPVVFTYTPTADASLYASSPSVNYGNMSTLELNKRPLKEFLMKFTVSGVGTQSVVNAKLRLYGTVSASQGGEVYAVADNTWSEGAVTWNTAPTTSAGPIATIGKVVKDAWVEVDISSYITGDGEYSLRVLPPASKGVVYQSKEASTGLAPRLEVSAL